jgi:hypothetical protein
MLNQFSNPAQGLFWDSHRLLERPAARVFPGDAAGKARIAQKKKPPVFTDSPSAGRM